MDVPAFLQPFHTRNYSTTLKSVNERFLNPKDKICQDSNDYVNTSNSRGWQEFLKNDYNKENCGAASNLYSRTPQRVHYKKVRQPLELYEENSQDSGHPSSPINEKENKRREIYVENCAMLRNVPMEYSMCSFASAPSPIRSQYKTTSSKTLLRSLSSGYDSMDDGIVNELNDMETMDEETQLPSGIAKLLSGDIVAPEASTDYDVSTTPDFSRTMSSKVKKWLSSPLEKMPPLSKIRTCLFRSPTASCSKRTMMRTYSYDEATAPYYRLQMEISPHSARSYKRPSEDLLEDEASILKRSRKSNNLSLDTTPVSAKRSSTTTHSRSLQRSLSERTGLTETHTNIKWAIHRSITDSDLIGDFSKPCILPLTSGIHGDLKTITSDTLAALLRGEFADRVGSYTIIDCRYPYEYEAGHIAGAMNVYNMDLIQQVMLDHLINTVPKIQLDTDKRNIIVFHCEFSWERGPNLSRFLRKLDRACNKEYYPALYYPEMYLLLGGYEKFYSEQKEFCSPQDYKPMKHPNHEEECRFFRRKCKSWQAEKTKGINQAVRTNLERFAF
ncbi:PREDICTED: M-phase inducer phosphatase-like [Atta cephalotes]|uniref:protein-tyrosine-phosphatase n=1 Tax=Atta cephalotes TaxID=12957 RepID=A0A158NVV6_ATTCE|nr:PREDICTED: M-phase inducer phosphatase-like [Atta cephalotes]